MGCGKSKRYTINRSYRRINDYEVRANTTVVVKGNRANKPLPGRSTRRQGKHQSRPVRTRKATVHVTTDKWLDYPQTYHNDKKSKFELMVKCALECMFPQVGFRTVRPNFNMGDKGRPLELDIYSHCYRFAVEAHGRQHSEFVPKFHKVVEKFHAQQERDELKRTNMTDAGIVYVEVPYTCRTEEQVIEYIEVEFEKMGGYEPVFYCGERCKHAVNWREDSVE